MYGAFRVKRFFGGLVLFFWFLVFAAQFLGSTAGPFLRPDHGSSSRRAQPPSRLAAGHRRRRREAALTGASTARRYPGRAGPSGRSLPVGSEGSSPAARNLAFRSNLVFGTTFRSETMMQSCASTAKLRRAGPIYNNGTKAMGGSGTPPPRIVIGNVPPESGRAPNKVISSLPRSLLSFLHLSRRAAPDGASCLPALCRW